MGISPLFLVVQLERALSRLDEPPVHTVRTVDIPYCIYYNPILRVPKQTHVTTTLRTEVFDRFHNFNDDKGQLCQTGRGP